MNFSKFLAPLALFSLTHSLKAEDKRPNVLWIMIEDWGKDLSCYGTKGVSTPFVDQLASEGILFNNAFTTAPVCSAARSAMMTGFHQNYIGANQHRLAADEKKTLPFGIKPIPKLMEEAGYYTCLMSWKVDCNFVPFEKNDIYMGTKDWTERKSGQPFFATITVDGTHREFDRDSIRPIDTKDVELPPYYADTDFNRRDWANGLEAMQVVDRKVGALLKRLKDEGLAENTLVFFIGDNGSCHIRGKQFLYDAGTSICMAMRWPGKVKPHSINNDLVYSIDIDATILEAAGVKPLVPLQGKSIFSNEVKNRKYLFTARDKMDDTHDAMRAVRTKEYKLIQNLMPERAYCQYNKYKEDSYPMLAEMNILYLEGKLTPGQAAFFAPTKPDIELYDLKKDPFEMNNVATDAKYAKVKTELLAELINWCKNVIKDKGVSDDFRAKGIYPDKCPLSSVDKWCYENLKNFDVEKYGAPSWYPTRSLDDWKKVREIWVPYLYRQPNSRMAKPNVSAYPEKSKKNAD